MSTEGGRRPACTIIGGPNGSGKSTIYERLKPPGLFVNADIIARDIDPDRPEPVSLPAGKRTLSELARILEARESFVYETTLSSRQSIALMHKARAVGYEVGLVFVALNSAALNVQRVADRVARGGHNIAETVIRRRYETALKRLPDAIRLAHGCILFDNSLSVGPNLLLKLRGVSIEHNNLDEADAFHQRLAKIVGDAIAISTSAVMRAARPS